MGSQVVVGPLRRLSIPSGAVGPNKARTEVGTAPSESVDSHLLAAALRGRQPRSAPAVRRATAKNQAGRVSGAAGLAPARGKIQRWDGQTREAWGQTIRLALEGPPVSPPPLKPPRRSRECKPESPPVVPLTTAPTPTRVRAPDHPLTAAGCYLETWATTWAALYPARAPEPNVSGPRPARAPETPSSTAPPRRHV